MDGQGRVGDSSSPPVTVQGGALRTWAFLRPGVERVRILLNTEGRPLNANLELWHGPDNTPQKVAVYLEDGNLRSFSAVIETPQDHNAIAVYNTGCLEFPFWASVEPELGSGATVGIAAALQSFSNTCVSKTIQGGAIHSIPFPAAVESVALLLTTDGRPLNARIELLQGPNNNKQIMEVYTEDGLERPFYAILEKHQGWGQRRPHLQYSVCRISIDGMHRTVFDRARGIGGRRIRHVGSLQSWMG